MTRQEAIEHSDKHFCCNCFVEGYDEGFSFGKEWASIECAKQLAKQAATLVRYRKALETIARCDRSDDCKACDMLADCEGNINVIIARNVLMEVHNG